MRQASTRFKSLGILLLLSLLLLFFWKRYFSSEFPLDLHLSNGSILRIREWGYGRKIMVGKREGWRRLVAMMPQKFRPSKVELPSALSMEKPSLFLIYEPELSDGESTTTYDFRWVDENGVESSSGRGSEWNTYIGTNSVWINTFSIFPMRSRTVKLRIYEKIIDPKKPGVATIRFTLLGEVALQNRFRDRSARWKEESLPQSRFMGKYTFQLLSAEITGEGPLAGLGDMSTKLKVRVLNGNETDDDWSLYSVTSHDPIGRSTKNSFLPWGEPEEGVIPIYTEQSLWPAEPLRFHFEWKHVSNLSSKELLVISNLAIPPRGGFTEIGLSTNIMGQKITVQGLAAAGVQPPWTGGFMSDGGLQISKPRMKNDNDLTVISAVDNEGQKIKILAKMQNGDENLCYVMRFLPSAKSVTITIQVPETMAVDFVAKPRMTPMKQ
jgi:hypothetical protein